MQGQFDGLVQFTRDFGYGLRGGGPGFPVHGWGFPIGFVIAALIFAGLVAAVIILSVRLARRDRRRTSESIEIVKVRYAKGEISKNEFEELKEDLS
ncbi:MAG: SHOCT domain-containing protein [Spirochaetes bacterium]|nr:SHOCT domain-containing protein [Spirochaetota bacterium]